ncbi:hypothetical protein SAMN05444397_109218 [Flavobacterium aquidurense]|uniref:DUF7832 domain-containing protein n=1 Tax=Flavobacterium frigidimaris TaxID=262320 RepID=A0ABX4BUS1_FLAFR|nr:hypothetical protein [Flavobacterium frigidimaris]OXA81073.1 hypothetical protein B0A65_04835 [Flavobacterium frigidimaris]SDZ58806.1 hypothetical protein SAMN05444397_109218 [Flavobacterium aquidurense]
MASIDRIDWHQTEDFPENVPLENGGTHIGMYLNWIIENNLIGEIHLTESASLLEDVKAKKITGRDFLIKCCDGKFWAEDLNEIGLKFTEDYYSSDKYFGDYANNLDSNQDSIYEYENSWENYEKIGFVIDKRFKEWQKKSNKKPWQFWK